MPDVSHLSVTRTEQCIRSNLIHCKRRASEFQPANSIHSTAQRYEVHSMNSVRRLYYSIAMPFSLALLQIDNIMIDKVFSYRRRPVNCLCALTHDTKTVPFWKIAMIIKSNFEFFFVRVLFSSIRNAETRITIQRNKCSKILPISNSQRW